MKWNSLGSRRHRWVPFSVIVRDLYTMSISVAPFKADPKLVVDSDTVLAFAISGEGLQPVSRESCEIT